MLVEVTDEDIKLGKPSDCENCAVALAVKRATGKEHVEVSESIIRAGVHCFDTPSDVETFIGRFDNGDKVEPVSFELVEYEPRESDQEQIYSLRETWGG